MEPALRQGDEGGPLAAQGQVPAPEVPDHGAVQGLGQHIGVRQLEARPLGRMVLDGLPMQGRQVRPEGQGLAQGPGRRGMVVPQAALEDAEPPGGEAIRGGGQHLLPEGSRIRHRLVSQQATEGPR